MKTTSRMSCKYSRQIAVLFACTCSQGIFAGIPLAAGILYAEWCDVFADSSKEKIAWIVSLNAGLLYAGGPVVSFTAGKIGIFRTYIVGTFISSISLLVSSFMADPLHLLLSFGLAAGLGNAMCYLPSSVTVNLTFGKRRLTANAIASSGVGFGMFAGSFLLERLIERYGWQGCLMLYSSIALQGLVFAVFIRPPPGKLEGSLKANETQNVQDNNLGRRQRNPHIRVLTRVDFHAFFVANFLFNVSAIIIISVLPKMAINAGHSQSQAAYLITTMAITNFVGRFICFLLGFQHFVGTLTIVMISTALTSIPVMLTPVAVDSYVGLIGVCALYGSASGVQMAAVAPALIEVVPIELFLYSLGWLALADGSGVSVGAPMAGFIYDKTKSFSIGFYIGGTTSLLSSTLYLFINLRKYLTRNRDAEISVDDESLLS